jgi:hypothetical protein
MSDANKKPGFVTRVRAVFVRIGTFIWNLFRQLWSLVSDKHWDFDPWKLGGWGALGLSSWFAIKTVVILEATKDPVAAGIVAGLSTAFITVGTFLFGQSVTNDKNLPDKT